MDGKIIPYIPEPIKLQIQQAIRNRFQICHMHAAVPIMCGHDDYLVKFIWCLRSSAADASNAHIELADFLESEHKDMLTRQVSLTEEISEKTIL